MKMLWELPAPSCGFTVEQSLSLKNQRCASLSFQYENEDGDEYLGELCFSGIEAFKCTYLTSLTTEMIDSAYDKLVVIEDSEWLTVKPVSDAIKHLRICFDDGPCYEFLCVDYCFSCTPIHN